MTTALEVSLKEQALEKMLVEMNEEYSPAVDQIHNWLCNQGDEDLLNGIMAEDKTINRAMKYCRDKAKESAKDGVAMIEDATVYGWVKEYFTTPDLAIDKTKPKKTKKSKKTHKPANQTNEKKHESPRDETETQALIKPVKKVGEQLDIFDYLG
ncbi:Cas9 inhibitor AcrIIA9 family protein [Latilactobacillus sakei subsp. sakei]|uniref:Cas9 inhibitor AcrIIA9 family protein n=1 Tax=Latilactobacillus sakei TaxID=1599 RepID=UPI0028613BC8|nr:Cas9 inhibitor AcrIIA9 family protein [Latilactobacillus sakei]MDR7924353.1 Cas9 inhibitor AcrIIA9 family protein [Latilactobacillus sakei subsp. sakei]